MKRPDVVFVCSIKGNIRTKSRISGLFHFANLQWDVSEV